MPHFDFAMILILLVQIERDYIPHGTKEALTAKKAQWVVLGKLKGTIQSSMYYKDKERIREQLALGVPQKHIVETHLGYGRRSSALFTWQRFILSQQLLYLLFVRF